MPMVKWITAHASWTIPLAQWISSHSHDLQLISFIMAAFSLLFGAYFLGRFKILTKQGGVYAAVLVAIPGSVFVALLWYVFDSRLGFIFTNSLANALRLKLNPIVIPLFFGCLGGIQFLASSLEYDKGDSARVEKALTQIVKLSRQLLTYFVSLVLGLRFVSSHIKQVSSLQLTLPEYLTRCASSFRPPTERDATVGGRDSR